MATSTRIAFSVVDEEPGALGAVGLSVDSETYEITVIEVRQEEDVIAMSVEHARALHAALGQLIEHAAQLP